VVHWLSEEEELPRVSLSHTIGYFAVLD
jgi:hypothetical protein